MVCFMLFLGMYVDSYEAILTSFNRYGPSSLVRHELTSRFSNFKSRNDGNSLTMNFLASPTIVTAMAFSGKLSFNPMTDSLTLASGEPFKFNPPSGQDLPSSGFALGDISYQPPPMPYPQPETDVIIHKDSQRLEALEPFHPHFKDESILELPQMKVLMRVRGKCTTDHISAAVSSPRCSSAAA
jgi:homoaconitase